MTIAIATLNGDGQYLYKVIGESQFQDVLERIVGEKTEDGWHYSCHAILLPEPKNKYDRNAVAVYVNGQHTGYLSSQDNMEFLQSLRAGNIDAAQCGAKIVGGWLRGDGDEGFFGVRLNAVLPFELGDRRFVDLESHVASLPAGIVTDTPRSNPGSQKRNTSAYVTTAMILSLVVIGWYLFKW